MGPAHGGGVWRQGNLLVMARQAQLPPLCVKTGLPAEQWLKRNYTWCNPAWYLLMLIALLPALIVILVLTKRATIYVPITQEVRDQRRGKILLGWLVALLALAMLIAGIVLISNENGFGVLLIMGFFIVLIVGAIIGSRAAQVIFPKRINNQFVWFKGVNPDVLSTLEDWPFGSATTVNAPLKPQQHPNLPPQRH